MRGKITEGEKHFCASVWIVTKNTPKKILLVHHKKFNKWIQPGGHIEKFENPVTTAVREVKEETGIDISFLLNKIKKIDEYGSFLPVPQFVMEQTIPKYKDQPKHFHIDINYTLQIDEKELTHNPVESKSIGWFTKKEALSLPTHEDTRIIVKKLL